MSRDQMEKQLADERALRDAAQVIADKAQTVVDRHIVAVAKLELDLAEGEKPELRHGDYGICKSNRHMCLYVRRKNQMELFGETKGSGYPQDTPLSDHLMLGNIFDDLKELSKPLQWFGVGCGGRRIGCALNSVGDLEIKHVYDGETHFVGKHRISEFIRNLQRLAFTAQQEAPNV